MRRFLRCREFIMENTFYSSSIIVYLREHDEGMYTIIPFFGLLLKLPFETGYKSVCYWESWAEVKHIIYCHGWHSNTLHHKRISFHHNLFKTCIDTQVEGSIQNRHVCSSNFKYFSVSIVTSPITYVCYRNPTGDLTNFT